MQNRSRFIKKHLTAAKKIDLSVISVLRLDGKIMSLILVACYPWTFSRTLGCGPALGNSVVSLTISCLVHFFPIVNVFFFFYKPLYMLIM